MQIVEEFVELCSRANKSNFKYNFKRDPTMILGNDIEKFRVKKHHIRERNLSAPQMEFPRKCPYHIG